MFRVFGACGLGFDSDTFTKKMLKTTEKLKLDKNKVKSEMARRATQKGWTKMWQNAMCGVWAYE